MFLLVALVVLGLAVGAYFLFRDTMNRIQYVEKLRLYWITRDIGQDGEPFFTSRAFMRQTSAPYWRGKGIQFRFRRWTFQVGKLHSKASSLEEQLSNLGWLDAKPKEIRQWRR